jgi:hypothetical protein
MNTRPIVYLKEAVAEIDEIYTDYELIRSGLGERFYSALAKQTSRIASNPEMYGIIEDGMRVHF